MSVFLKSLKLTPEGNGHELSPNDGRRDGVGSDTRLRPLVRNGPVQSGSSQTPGKRQTVDRGVDCSPEALV